MADVTAGQGVGIEDMMHNARWGPVSGGLARVLIASVDDFDLTCVFAKGNFFDKFYFKDSAGNRLHFQHAGN